MVIIMENNNLSEFMKIAYKNGRVKDLDEAFKEFPVEEEWHKGKAEKLLPKFSYQFPLAYFFLI